MRRCVATPPKFEFQKSLDTASTTAQLATGPRASFEFEFCGRGKKKFS